MFGDIKIEKNEFYRHKSPIFLRDVDIEKVLVSNKIFLVKKTTDTLLVTCIMMIKLSYNIPADKYWSPGSPEDVPLKRPQDVP